MRISENIIVINCPQSRDYPCGSVAHPHGFFFVRGLNFYIDGRE